MIGFGIHAAGAAVLRRPAGRVGEIYQISAGFALMGSSIALLAAGCRIQILGFAVNTDSVTHWRKPPIHYI